MNEFVEATLGDVVELKRGYDLPHQNRRAGQVPIVSSSGTSGSHDEPMVSGPGVVTGRYGTLGQVFYVQEDFWPLNTTLYVRNFKGNDPRFIAYFLQSIDFLAYSDKAAVPGLNRNHLHTAPVKYPASLDEQQAIASILGTLDDKIDLNRRINETLEAMARAIFKDWFVDFSPTRAKMDARPPYLAPALWALFPDRFDKEGKPEGWPIETLYEQADWINGAAYKDMHFSDAGDALPVVKISELKSGLTSTTKRTNSDLGEKYRIGDGELLFSWSGNPDTSIDTFIWSHGPAWLNQHIFAVRLNGMADRTLLYSMLKHYRPEFSELARNKQTTGLGHVTKADMQRMAVCVGSPDIRAAFQQAAGPLVDRLLANLIETKALVLTRDTILPKLMSGEIHVRDTESLLGAVA